MKNITNHMSKQQRYITDFHIHSKYSRACSKKLDLEHLAAWAQLKGIHILSCADFTHPAWFNELKTKLIPSAQGLFRLKAEAQAESDTIYRSLTTQPRKDYNFILTTEISFIYSKGDKLRRLHIIIFAPDLETVEKINKKLDTRGKLASDGRPILGMDAKELTQICLDINPKCFIVPAHAWTPWFALFGSKSGFDSIEECFEELTPHIHAIETGLSSDPLMNWQLSQLDNITLLSNSDAHSLEKLAREANVFIGTNPTYDSIIEAIKAGAKGTKEMHLDHTIEFYPEEGKYYLDGHAKCNFSCTPDATKKNKDLCPTCKKPLTVGVLNRVSELADRSHGTARPENMIPFKSIVPLQEILSQLTGKGEKTKTVQTMYFDLINHVGTEFEILLDAQPEHFPSNTPQKLIQGIINMRKGNIEVQGGYDGVFGVINVCAAQKKKEG